MVEILRLTEAGEQIVNDINKLLPQLRGERMQEMGSLDDLKAIVGDSTAALIVAQDAGKTIGMATLYMMKKFGKYGGYVEDVVVDENYRGQGVGEKLMRELIVEAKKAGLTYMYLTSRPDRIAAHRLYEKLGFKKKETDVFRVDI